MANKGTIRGLKTIENLNRRAAARLAKLKEAEEDADVLLGDGWNDAPISQKIEALTKCADDMRDQIEAAEAPQAE